jgi:hypothetical protein
MTTAIAGRIITPITARARFQAFILAPANVFANGRDRAFLVHRLYSFV